MTKNLTVGSPMRLIIGFALPTLFGMLFQQFYNLVDTMIVGKLLGAHIAGAHATDLIAEAALALHMGATARDLAETIHAHPTLAEGVFEAAHMI